MHYSMKMISQSLPSEKNTSDSLWTRYILRPLSFPVTWVSLLLGISANGLSYISGVFSVGGGILLGVPGFSAPLIGAILLNFFSILDCADGNIARVTKTAGPWGSWADAVMGFVSYIAVFLGTGVYVYHLTGAWYYILIAALTSSANLLMRVAYQMYKNIEPDSAHNSVSLERMIAENIGITGFLMPALILCHFVGGMHWIIFVNALFYIGGCIVTLIKLAAKGGGV